jgi:hypothetical protein
MDRAAIFAELTRRNALRKAAQLPLLDLRAELAFALGFEEQRAYAEDCKKYEDNRKRIMTEVLTELRLTRRADFPTSIGGRWMVQLLSDRRFQAFLEIEHGIVKPAVISRHPVKYGELRKS